MVFWSLCTFVPQRLVFPPWRGAGWCGQLEVGTPVACSGRAMAGCRARGPRCGHLTSLGPVTSVRPPNLLGPFLLSLMGVVLSISVPPPSKERDSHWVVPAASPLYTQARAGGIRSSPLVGVGVGSNIGGLPLLPKSEDSEWEPLLLQELSGS